MKIAISTIDAADGSRRDHLLDVPQGCTVDHLAAAVDRDAPGAWRELTLNGCVLLGGLPVRGSGIRSGAVLGLGGPAPAPTAVRAGTVGSDEHVLAEVHLVSGPGAGKCWQVAAGSYEIGTDPQCAIRLAGVDIPGRGLWLTIRTDGTGYWHRAAGSRDALIRPATVERPTDTGQSAASRSEVDQSGADPMMPPGCTAWRFDEDLAVGPVLLRLVAPLPPDAATVGSADGFGLDYSRPPRVTSDLDDHPVQFPPPPPVSAEQNFPLAMWLAPTAFSFISVYLFDSYFCLLFSLLTPVLLVANVVRSNSGNWRAHTEARQEYQQRATALERYIGKAAVRERLVRCFAEPDPATIAHAALGPGDRLWERRRRDPNHLLVRIGTVDRPSVKVVDDPARDPNSREIRWNLPDVPVSLQLAESGVTGIAGATPVAQAVARWAVIQTAVLHSPRDVRIVVLTDPSRAGGWEWLAWLPHLRPASSTGPAVNVGNDEESLAARVGELTDQITARERAMGPPASRAMRAEPDILVIVDGARQLRDLPGLATVLTVGPQVRVFSLCVDDHERLLPDVCGAVVVANGTELTVHWPNAYETRRIRADLVDPSWCDEVARALAPVRDVSADGDAGLPPQVRLLDLLDQDPPDPAKIVARWRRQPADTRFVLGAGFTEPLALDLAHDGPHALVAGATGAGVSELLHSFVASLAVVNRPDELTFVLVDYKRANPFGELATLPHTVATLTDLDPYEAGRVLEALGGELHRREQLLADAQAGDLAAYHGKRAADPRHPRLPRLLLVVDEFATLMRDLPDFVRELIGLADRAAPAGIHLILGTQWPASVVTADVKAVTHLRIALRLTDGNESGIVIDTPDAAGIAPDTPGRALLRRPHLAVTPFQTAWLGVADAQAPSTSVRAREMSWDRMGRPVDLPLAGVDAAPTDLQALATAVRDAADRLDDLVAQPTPWLPTLDAVVLLDDLPRPVGVGRPGLAPIPYALEDLPSSRARAAVAVDLASFGHMFVIGAPRSGRTQVLHTIAGSAARTNSVADVHIYGVAPSDDALAALQALPHCGAVVPAHDLDRFERLLSRLTNEVTVRQAACSAKGCADLTELRRLLPPVQRPAHLLVLVDRLDELTPILDEHDNGRLAAEFTRLLRAGAATGVHVIATSERVPAGGRSAVHNRLLLRQNDDTEYRAGGIAVSRVPSVVPAGRGWHSLTGAQSQVALLDRRPGGPDQADALQRIGVEAAARDADVDAARRPFAVNALPGRIEFVEALQPVPAELRRPLWALIGVGGNDTGAVGVDLADTAAFLVAGPSGSGRSNALSCIAVSLLAGGASLVVLAPRESPVQAVVQHPQVRLLAGVDPAHGDLRSALDALPGPHVVVVDDADLIASPIADGMLRELSAAGRDVALVAAGQTDAALSATGGWLGAAKRFRRGLLLAPRSPQEGELIGVRLSAEHLWADHGPGRALTSGSGGVPAAVRIPLTVLRRS